MSEIGLGGWPTGGGWGTRDVAKALQALRRALDLGVPFFDTALGYGESEKLIGEAVRGVRDQVVIATTILT